MVEDKALPPRSKAGSVADVERLMYIQRRHPDFFRDAFNCVDPNHSMVNS